MKLSRQPVTGAPYCAAPLWLNLKGGSYPILPKAAAPYVLVPLVLLLALVVVLELHLRTLAAAGTVLGIEWQRENARVHQMNKRKVPLNPHDPRWLTAGMPWPEPSIVRTRILAVGDSFVWGDGNLNVNETWWRQLARELQRRGYWTVDVVALGIPGASTQDQLGWLKRDRWLERTDPDLVVFGYVTNDPAVTYEGKPMVSRIGLQVPLPDWPLLERPLGRVAPNLNIQVKRLLTQKWASKVHDAYDHLTWELKLLEEPSRSKYLEVLYELGEFLRESDRQHFFVSLPHWPSVKQFAPRYAAVRPLFDEAGLVFHDLLPDFAKEFEGTRPELAWGLNPANGHPGPTTTRFHAVKLADLLEREHSSALGPRSSPPPSLQPQINDWTPVEAQVEPAGTNRWTLKLPGADDLAPRLPIGTRHAVLSFEHPVLIRRVRLDTGSADPVELYATVVDPVSHIERNEALALGARAGVAAEWTIGPQHLVHTLKLAPGTKASEARPATLTIDFEPLAVQP